MVNLSYPEKSIDTGFRGCKDSSVGVIAVAIVTQDFVVKECVSNVIISA